MTEQFKPKMPQEVPSTAGLKVFNKILPSIDPQILELLTSLSGSVQNDILEDLNRKDQEGLSESGLINRLNAQVLFFRGSQNPNVDFKPNAPLEEQRLDKEIAEREIPRVVDLRIKLFENPDPQAFADNVEEQVKYLEERGDDKVH